MRRHWKRLLRLLPLIILTFIGVFGLIFPDQIKLVLAQPSEIATLTGHSPPKHLRFTSIALFLIALGVVQICLSWYGDVQAERPEPGSMKENGFLQAYTNAIVDAVSLLAFLSTFDEPRRIRAIGETLQILCTVAEVYKGDSIHHHHAFNACFYKPIGKDNLTDSQRSKVAPFMDKDRTSYTMFLEIAQWAYNGEAKDPKNLAGYEYPKPCVEIGFILPVDDNKQYTLFGAPYAFNEKKPFVVNDIKNENRLKKLPGMADHAVRDTMLVFFRGVKSYRSFICFPIHDEKGNYGVVSLQANVRCLCRLDNKFDQQMLTAMEPFLTVLALLLAPQ